MKEQITGKSVLENYQSGWKPHHGIVIGRGGNEYRPRANQNVTEITDLVDTVLNTMPVERRKLALEIGLETGGTHLILRQLFENVVSVEINSQSAMLFLSGLVNPERSKVICSNSQLPVTKKIVEKELAGQKVDMLFIDGDHSFNSCESDYINYEPLVAVGGTIAFHDEILCPDVGRFVKMIEEGTHPTSMDKLTIRHIHVNGGMGIACYVKP
jgi:predicted O-methyltransferase YrrM